jgi:hypothetical protein
VVRSSGPEWDARRERLGRVRLLFDVGQTAENLEDHSKIALGAEVRDIDAAELAA